MKKHLVISFAYACAQPGAVMVEAQNAVVTVVAMRGAKWPEDVAGFTKLDFVDVCISTDRTIILWHEIVNFWLIYFQFMIFPVDLFQGIFIKVVFRHNSWI